MQIRQVREEEFLDWRTSVRAGLGDHVSTEDSAYMRKKRPEIDRLLVCMDGGTIAGTGGADSFDMTLPGGAQVPVAGIAYVTTAATHRRRGIQRSIMKRTHDDARERGDFAAILCASQSNLYGRYGYGNAIPAHDWDIDLRHTAFRQAPSWSGQYLTPQRAEAIPLMTRAYENARTKLPGMITRTPGRWDYEVHPRNSKNEFFVIYVEDGESLAYARYQNTFEPYPEFVGEMFVIEAVAATDAAHAALWRFLFDQELVQKLHAQSRPVDDPLVWMLTEPRRLERKLVDCVWLKLLDTPRMLTSRAYEVEDAIALQIIDAESGASRTLELECGPDGSQCTETNQTPDLSMNESELAAIYFGAVECTTLVNLGLVEEAASASDSAQRANRIFKTSRAGWNPYHF